MITLMRHAESTYNASGDPSRDVPITEKGKLQASHVTGEYDLVIVSRLKRTQETLSYSKVKFRDLLYTDLCRENKDGLAVNLLDKEVIQIETSVELKQRVETFRRLLKNLSAIYPRILVISHAGFLYALTGLPWANAQQRAFSNL